MRRAWGIVALLLILSCAACCIYAYFRIEDAGATSDAVPEPLPVGVYLSKNDITALDSLQPTGGSGRPSWHVEVGTDAGDTARISVSFGELALDQFGSAYTFGNNVTLDGTLKHAITLAYTLPNGAASKIDGDDLQVAIAAAGGEQDPSICARWTDVRGNDVQIKTTWVSTSGGWPFLAICHIPPFANAKNVNIQVGTTVSASSLRESFVGLAELSVSNPETLITTMDQSDKVPASLMYTTAQDYTLHIAPPRRGSLNAIEPAPVAAAAGGVRAWSVRPGGLVATEIRDDHQQNIAGVLAQVLLILAGFFFGLFASATPWAIRIARSAK